MENIDQRRNELQEVADSLSKKLGVSKVHVVLFVDEESEKEYVTYLQEPNFPTKLRANDMIMQGIYTAANLVLETCVIKESSCIESYQENSTHVSDKVKLGICDYIISNMLNRFTDQFKKK